MPNKLLATLLACLVVTPAFAELRYIDANRDTGSAAAIVVPDSEFLLHTAQFSTTARDGEKQLSHLLVLIERAIPLEILRQLPKTPKMVKLNFVVVRDELRPKLEEALAAAFPEDAKPAVS